MFNFIDIYSFNPVSGCVGMCTGALLCPRDYHAVKTALLLCYISIIILLTVVFFVDGSFYYTVCELFLSIEIWQGTEYEISMLCLVFLGGFLCLFYSFFLLKEKFVVKAGLLWENNLYIPVQILLRSKAFSSILRVKMGKIGRKMVIRISRRRL